MWGALALLGLSLTPFWGVAQATTTLPTVTVERVPQVISAAPFPISVRVSGLEAETPYLYTARLRTANSSSDQGSFWDGTKFGTSYVAAGESDGQGALLLQIVINPGAATEYSGIRLRFKINASDPTPSPVDISFARTVLTSPFISGHAYDGTDLLVEGYAGLIDGADNLVTVTGVGRSGASPWLTDPGAFALTAPAGSYRLRSFDEGWGVMWTSASVTVSGDLMADINPPPAAPPPDPVSYSDQLRLSELLPNPVGEDTAGEYIELENRSGEAVELEGWSLWDESGSSHTFAAGTTLPDHGFLSVPYTLSKITLNNGGDGVKLLDPDGVERDQTSYGSAKEGEAWAWDETSGGWGWSIKPTLEARNEFPALPEAPPAPFLSIAELRSRVPTEAVRVRGVVTAPTGLLGSKVSYLQDETGGIQVYGDLGLATSAAVEVTGVLSSTHGERRLKANESLFLGPGVMPVAPLLSRAPTESEEGELVRIKGRISRVSGQTVWLGVADGEAQVVVRSNLGWKRPVLHTGDLIEVVGVVSQYTDLDALEVGYRLLPRFAEDLRVLESKPKTVAAKKKAAAKSKLVKTAHAAGQAEVKGERKSVSAYLGGWLAWSLGILGVGAMGGAIYRALQHRKSGGD